MKKEPDLSALSKHLLERRIIMLGTPIDDSVSTLVIAQMLFLQMEPPRKPVQLVVNSPGGSVTAGLAILDTMSFLKVPVWTHCAGRALSLAALLVASGAPGHRTTVPGASFSIGPVWTTNRDPGTAGEVQRLKDVLVMRIASPTGRLPHLVRADMESERFLDAAAAIEYGLVDGIAAEAPLP